jgi:uroporphyrinogen decarboxylase
MKEMTSYERIMTALEGGKPDRVPVIPFLRDWGIRHSGFTFAEILDNPCKYVHAQYRALRDLGADIIWDLMGVHAESEAMGSVLKIQEDSPPSVVQFAVNDPDKDLDRLRLPNPHRDGRLPQLLDVVHQLKALVRDEVPVVAYVQGPFRHAAMLRGTENLLKDMMSKKMADEVEPHFTRLTETLIRTGARVFLHLCGDFGDRMDTIRKIGMHGVSLDEKNDLQKAREILGPDVCIIGNVNPTGTLLSGTTDMVETESAKAIEKAGRDGAFILASGCLIPNNAPRENIEALVAAAKQSRY